MKRTRATLGAIAALMLVAACGSGAATQAPADTAAPATPAPATEAPATEAPAAAKVALLLPESQTARYEKFDRPAFEAGLKADCADCEFLYANAQGDAAKQQSQVETMVAQGAKVLVIFPVDSAAIKPAIQSAHDAGAKVIIYGREAEGPYDFGAFYAIPELGASNGQILKDALSTAGITSGNVVMLNGDASWSGVPIYAQGAKDALGSGFTIAKEYEIKNWDPANAQTSMDQAITALGKDGFVGVVGMNDGIAGGAIAAMKAAGIAPVVLTTGMDADLAAVQRMIVGDQLGSASTSPISYATSMAEIAAKVAQGQEVTPDSTDDQGRAQINVPVPVAITVANIQSELIDKGVYAYDELCTADFKAACDAIGLKPKS